MRSSTCSTRTSCSDPTPRRSAWDRCARRDGAAAVASTLSGGAQAARVAIVDGVAALVWAPGDRTRGVIEFTLAGDKIVVINVTGDDEYIRRLDIVPLDG